MSVCVQLPVLLPSHRHHWQTRSTGSPRAERDSGVAGGMMHVPPAWDPYKRKHLKETHINTLINPLQCDNFIYTSYRWRWRNQQFKCFTDDLNHNIDIPAINHE